MLSTACMVGLARRLAIALATHKPLPALMIGALGLSLSGCISVEIQGQSSGDMKAEITESQFYKDASVFYPDANVQDPERLEPLSTTEQKRLQSDLSNYLRAIQGQHQHNFDAYQGIFGDTLAQADQARIILTLHDVPEARTSANGEIAIDTRVVQSILRSSLLTTFETEIMIYRVEHDSRRGEATYTLAEEKIAIDTYLDLREQLKLTPGRSHLGELFRDPDESRAAGELDWFEMRRLSRQLSDVDVRYDSQLLFLLAHEYGHLVLDHFGDQPLYYSADTLEDPCHIRRSMEVTADVYAAILITLATPGNATSDFLGLFGGATVFDGLDTFFRYAYDYSGFADGETGHTCSNYPPPAERLALMKQFYDTIRSRQLGETDDQ